MSLQFPVTRLAVPCHRDLVCLSTPVQDLEHTLRPSERHAIGKAVDKRRREYATGRWLAHRALAELNVSAPGIPTGPKREPLWPDGVVGAITHTDGIVAVAVTTDVEVAGVGILSLIHI